MRQPYTEGNGLRRRGVTGRGAAADLKLAGLDEYVYEDLGTPAELGAWTVSYYREEFADHGRPDSGRQGGEPSVQREQDEPRARGTSTSGGSDRGRTDPGEYF
jgi:hypothetical protein